MTRRHLLQDLRTGLGSIALTWLLHKEGAAAESRQGPHFPPKAKRVVQIFANGGVSHLDTFDFKPDLIQYDGKPMTGKGPVDPFFGKPGNLMRSQWEFQQRGSSGLWVSDMLPHLATCVDDITFIHSMVTKSSNHTPAAFQMHTGFIRQGFPCLGAWLSYGLGTENQDLPAFVVLPDPRGLPAGASINWSSGFLPATHQGTAFGASGEPIADLATPPEVSPESRQAALGLLAQMNRNHIEAHPGDNLLTARVRSYELAARMQVTVPQVIRFDEESEATQRLYGMDAHPTEAFGRNCLLARRLLERGVRFVQIFHGGAFGGSPRLNWDAHEDVVDNHNRQAQSMDKPVAGLIKDLKARGMLDETLVIWSTEFGRTPFTQGLATRGRDHHQHAFTCWLAGAGVKKGFSYGASDEVGYQVGEDPVTIYDFHATILQLLGLDHKRLTYYNNGIQRRLTDVHGRVVEGILA
jgi:hypothetical protein